MRLRRRRLINTESNLSAIQTESGECFQIERVHIVFEVACQ